MEKTPEELYNERLKRVEDAIQLKVPDRVPLLLSGSFFPTNYAGLTCQEAMYDYDQIEKTGKKFVMDFQPDMYRNPFRFAIGHLLDYFKHKQLLWPGHGVSPLHSFQFVEGEYMKAEEYDGFLFDPSDYIMRVHLPRICGALEPLKNLPRLSSLHYTEVMMSSAVLNTAEFKGMMETLFKAGAEVQKIRNKAIAIDEEFKKLGFPMESAGNVLCPFDYIGDYFRGTKGIMLDMYRRPDKLLAALEKILPIIIESAISSARKSGIPRVFIPLHKGAEGFMSLEQFKTFYWPGLRKLMLALISEGLTPFPFFEGYYQSRLEIIADIPRGKAVYRFEHTDMSVAKKVLGDHICIRGNVPASMLCTGSPKEVKDYCKKLIDTAGKGGGFILDGANGIPDEAKVENVRAMVDAAREYGVYR